MASYEEDFRASNDATELCRVAEGHLGGLFSGRLTRVFLWSEVGYLESFQANPMWQAFWREQGPLHEAQLVDSQTWRRYCPRADHGHVLLGPLVGNLEIIGAAAVTRAVDDPPFDAADLARMNRFCLFLSTRRSELLHTSRPALEELTSRENDVVQGVCRGLRNAEIARECNISEHTVKQNLKSIFRKLNVTSRTQVLNRVAGKV